VPSIEAWLEPISRMPPTQEDGKDRRDERHHRRQSVDWRRLRPQERGIADARKCATTHAGDERCKAREKDAAIFFTIRPLPMRYTA